MRAHAADLQRAKRWSQRAPGAGFAHVMCAAGSHDPGTAVRRQSAVLAAARAVVECTPAGRLTPDACGALLERCEGVDLLAVAAGDDALRLLERATMPVLLARPGRLGTEVTDRMVIAVDDSVDPEHAAEVVGLLARRDNGQVAVAAAPEYDRALQRAIAASHRAVLQSTGAVPRVFGDEAPPEHAIPTAAATFDATLVVLPMGKTDSDKARSALIARHASCSVLALPAPRIGPAVEARDFHTRLVERPGAAAIFCP